MPTPHISLLDKSAPFPLSQEEHALAYDACRKESLTETQFAVAVCVAEGFLNKQIADKMSITPQTVKNHTYEICSKLGLKGRVDLAVFIVSGGKRFKGEWNGYQEKLRIPA